jgi:hypothetical protein
MFFWDFSENNKKLRFKPLYLIIAIQTEAIWHVKLTLKKQKIHHGSDTFSLCFRLDYFSLKNVAPDPCEALIF